MPPFSIVTRSGKKKCIKKNYVDVEIMEANTCDAARLDSNVLLPPRKRLLACMKKQNGDGNGNGNGNGNQNGNQNGNGNSYLPSTSSPMINFNTRINNLLSAHLSDGNPSQEEIVEASRSAAEVAVKIAIAARAAAEEKAVIATVAMAAAKKALELVADINDQETSSFSERQLKKNKTKKRVEVQMLYDNKKPRVENDKTSDEELARQLHQVINSSPRISKYGSAPDLKDYEHKRLKIPTISENGRNNDQSIAAEENFPSSSNRNKLICERVAHIGDVDENTTKSEKGDLLGIHSKVKFGEDDSSTLGRKRGRMKQKKLPLSICHDRDQLNPKEDRRWRSSELVDKNIGKVASAKDKGSSANGVMPIERTSLWKCQSFKASARLKQNKAMQS